jgi:hypothetical protein
VGSMIVPRRALTIVATSTLGLAACGGSGASTRPPISAPTGAINCDSHEGAATHIHAGLAIVVGGRPVIVPADIGVTPGVCLYWLHTHQPTGVLHVESPLPDRAFTLGDFFAVWGKPLSATTLLDATGTVRAWVDGKPFTADPATIPLRDRQTIVLSDTDLPGALPVVDFSELAVP